MLDEKFELSFYVPGDDNCYTYGRIGVLNVVLSPLSETNIAKTTIVATVATSMRRTFARLKLILLLGAAGAIPNDVHDMRLGDAVIAVPSDGSSGIVQYSFPETEVIRELASPPQSILDCVRQFQFELQDDPEKITKWMEEGLNKFPHMKRTFGPPSNRVDRLFHADYLHISQGCYRCDSSRLVQRGSRADTNPRLFYGAIATADTEIFNAKERDKIGRQTNCLCVDTGSAGLQLIEVPTIVIRCIINYADSHSKEQRKWRDYAAMTGAACAKGFILDLSTVSWDMDPSEHSVDSAERLWTSTTAKTTIAATQFTTSQGTPTNTAGRTTPTGSTWSLVDMNPSVASTGTF
ncbi:conserved hypothetical protein [Talaromyces stipitatus ATCC 10500]|uniref:Nucleoside phosphorylase domain-containing protein n=1 Tax=Talaromyces stipitatus (strain ATCC 10500 / CBS 375.48 / QM 6759 / NRRL 1006) TaxID=441959 RepID=B8MUZ5_TALSN|nr:uncharacterized protein TSTA_110640 [Talaromyces stipitatus ATCC 10500]EED11885.1 conserved hypothetical protein [Talaromyces stipitatus ATCC 10500]